MAGSILSALDGPESGDHRGISDEHWHECSVDGGDERSERRGSRKEL